MRVDLVLPSESATDDPRALAELAVAAERYGFGAVWLPDHLLLRGVTAAPTAGCTNLW